MLMRTSLNNANQRKHCEVGIQVLVGIHDVLFLSAPVESFPGTSTACAYAHAGERALARASCGAVAQIGLFIHFQLC